MVLAAPWQAQAQSPSQSHAPNDTVVVPPPRQNLRHDGNSSERYTCAELNLHNVSVYGLDGMFCVVDTSCSGNMDNHNGIACPTIGAVDLSGNTTLVTGSCCAPFPNGTLGCMLLDDDQQSGVQPRCLSLGPDDEDDDETIQIPPEMLDWSASSDSDSQSTGSSNSDAMSANSDSAIVIVSSASSSSGVDDTSRVEHPVSRRGSESVSFTSDYGSAAAGDLTSKTSSASSASPSNSGSDATETSTESAAAVSSLSGESSTSTSEADAETGLKHGSALTAKPSNGYSNGSSSIASADIEAPSSAASGFPEAGSTDSLAPSTYSSSPASSSPATTKTPTPTGTAYLPTIPATIESSTSSISNDTSSSKSQDAYSTSTSNSNSEVANLPVFVVVGLSACAAVVFGTFLLRMKVKPPSQSEATVMMHSGSPEHESTGVSSVYMQAMSSPRIVRSST